MAQSPLESGPVVGADLKENIAEGYQRLGNVVQEPVAPGVTGDMVYQARMARAQAITGLAKGIEQGFSPLIDSMISGAKQQQQTTDQTTGYAAGAAAGAGIGNCPLPGAPPAGTQPPATTGTPAPAPAGTPAPAPPGGGSILTRGLSGDLNILPNFNLFGTNGNSGSATYAKNYASAAVVNAGMATDADINQIRVKYPNDPEGFKGASDAYINSRDWSLLGPAGGPARTNAMQTASQHYNNLVLQKGASDLVDSKNVIATQIDNVSNDMSALARAGQINSPQFDQKQDQLQDLYGSLKENPAYGLSPAEVDDQLTKRLNGFIGDHISGQVDSAYQQGGASAALKSVQDNIDKVPGLSDADRAEMLKQGAARVTYNEGINRDTIDANRKDVATATQQANAGQPVDPSVWDRALATARQTGDTESITTITAQRAAHPANPITNGITPSQNQPQPATQIPTSTGAVTQLPAVGNANLQGVNPDLLDIVARANTHLQAGYHAEIFSSSRPDGPAWSQHHNGNAVDIQIIGPNGRITPEGADITGKYGEFAHYALAEQQAHHPELNGKLAWGGNFGTVPGGNIPDLMHFDLGGDRGHFGRLASTPNAPISTLGRGPAGQADPNVMTAIQTSGASPEVQKIMTGIYAGESLHIPGHYDTRINAQEESYGPFQFNVKGGLGAQLLAEGIDVRDPSTVPAQAKWLAAHLAADPSLVNQFHGYADRGANMVASGWGTPGYRGGGGGQAPSSVVSANGVPFTNDQLKNSPGLYSAYVSAVSGDANTRAKAMDYYGSTIQTSLNNLRLPSPQDMATYQQLAQGNLSEQARLASITGGAQSLIERQGSGGGIGGGLGPGTVPGAGGAAPYQAQVSTLAGGSDLFHQAVGFAHDKMNDEAAKFAKSHPIEYAARAKFIDPSQVPPPVNYSDPQSIASGLPTNAAIIGRVARREPGVSASAIPPSDLESAKNVMSYGTPQLKTALLSAITSLPSPAREATLAALGQTGASGAAFAQAGHVASFNPQAANDILHGQAILQEEPRYAPKAEDRQYSFGNTCRRPTSIRPMLAAEC